MKYLPYIYATILFFTGAFLLSQSEQQLGATILSTNSSDTLETFRTNVNSSLTSLNAAVIAKVATSSSETLSRLAYWTSTAGTPATLGGVATTTATLSSSSFTYSGTLGALVGGSSGTLSHIENRSFSYATTTTWLGTTTVPIEVGYGEVWNTIKCYTNTGTVNVHVGYGTASTTIFNASTTIGSITVTPNNTMTSGVKVVADIGTPASSPQRIACTINNTI